MYKAIERANHASLRALAKIFIRIGNDPAALLCLDHVFSSPLELLNLSFVEIWAHLSLFLDYIRLLNKFRSDGSLADDSNHQRLFGFQLLEGNCYLAPKHTPLYENLTNRSSVGGNSADGYRCSYDELRRAIIQLISTRIHNRTEVQDSACRGVHGFSPCLYIGNFANMLIVLKSAR